MAAPAFNSCTAAVLAGGRGTRFGGDKPLAPFRGTTLLAHLVGELASLGFAEILVVAKDPEPYRIALSKLPNLSNPPATQIRFIGDETPLYTPLAGLCAAMRESKHDIVFACAADMPFAADPALIESMLLRIEGEAAIAPTCGGESQPLYALWNRDRCLAAAESLLSESRGPRALLEKVRAASLDWSDSKPFQDADTCEDLALLEQRDI